MGGQRARQIVLGHLQPAHPIERTRQVALPTGIGGIGIRQSLPDGESRLQ